MPIGKLATCLVVLCAAVARQGFAQDDVNVEEKTPLTISGFAVGSGSFDNNLKRNTATASKLAVSMFRPWSDQLYLFAQLTTHVSQHDTSEVHTHIEIDNLIVNWTPAKLSALSLSFGRFDAPIGFERDDEPLNLVPTESFNLENARPVKFTGLLARYAVSPKISVLGVVANGWDSEIDNNSGKTAGAKLQAFPASGLAIAVGAFYGPEEDSTNSFQRTLLTGDATWQPSPRLILQAEAHRGSQPGVSWTGVVGQGFMRLGRATGLTVRGEMFDDPDGARTGTAQKLSSVTISPWYFYREAQEGVFSNVEFTNFRLPALSVRPAVRFDHSNQPVFDAKGGTLKQSNVTALVELVFVF